jgi:hypothetical protein
VLDAYTVRIKFLENIFVNTAYLCFHLVVDFVLSPITYLFYILFFEFSHHLLTALQTRKNRNLVNLQFLKAAEKGVNMAEILFDEQTCE